MALNRFKTLAAALPFAFTAAVANADDVSQVTYTPDAMVDTPVEVEKAVWMRAADYAEENKVVAIALYAAAGDPNIDKIEASLEGWFAQRGVQAETFVGEGVGNGYAVTFYIKGIQLGTTPVNAEAMPNMQKAVDLLPGVWQPPADLVASLGGE